jgi:hypothetical protein
MVFDEDFTGVRLVDFDTARAIGSPVTDPRPPGVCARARELIDARLWISPPSRALY